MRSSVIPSQWRAAKRFAPVLGHQMAYVEIRELKRKVSELERTIEILSAAAGFFAREHDPLRR